MLLLEVRIVGTAAEALDEPRSRPSLDSRAKPPRSPSVGLPARAVCTNQRRVQPLTQMGHPFEGFRFPLAGDSVVVRGSQVLGFKARGRVWGKTDLLFERVRAW